MEVVRGEPMEVVRAVVRAERVEGVARSDLLRRMRMGVLGERIVVRRV